ncbi:MAG: hypothetical protein DRN05_01210 [Thermoplasmata archaeon]|nr:MAG: hypothetical protein DRN05_01210 [Thermoplasmata archaeon]
MKKNICSKKIVLGISTVLIIAGLATLNTPNIKASNTIFQTTASIELIQEFPSLSLREDSQYSTIIVDGTNSFTHIPSKPMIPIFTKTFKFPFGTKINKIKIIPQEIKTMKINKRIKPVPTPQHLEKMMIITTQPDILDTKTYNSHTPYPSRWYSCIKGTGINRNGSHVLYLTIHLYPIRYIPAENIIQHARQIRIQINYEKTVNIDDKEEKHTSNNKYDLVVITPEEFYDNLQPLVNHKNNHSIETNIVTLQSIYNEFSGRDHAEQIKYFIKYAVEEWNTTYVLLVGDIRKTPTRTTYASPWGKDILSDLYYADIYDENYTFCSWDANNNSRFGEVIYDNHTPIDIDDVDLYPDVYVGRLACESKKEVDIIVNKIVNYEEKTYDQAWFKRIILVGGDTFPPFYTWAKKNVFEGEITNTEVAENLPNFSKIRLWTSKHNLRPITFNIAVTKGAGFISYAGHGFEHGFGTYRPNAIMDRMIFYYTPFLHGIRNHYRLPIIFLDACLTAKLDFNMSDLARYYPWIMKLLGERFDPSIYLPCFAWSFVCKKDGGVIAAVGSTRSAYTWVNENGVHAGAGYLDVHFFKAYDEGITVSEMLVQSQNDYINYVGKDFFTLEEFLLLGDPSLIVGGYP